jgi:hypothetical protein
VVRVFVDDGQSGGTLDRPALTELRETVAAGEVAAVVVYAVDRLSRRQADTLALLAIADGLNADGVPTPTAARGEARGLVSGPGRCHAATVAKLCRNPHVLRVAQAQ